MALDGPYNEHLVRDIGGLNLALAFVAVMALVTGSTLLARVTGGAALVFGVPHLLYHATHLDGFETGDASPCSHPSGSSSSRPSSSPPPPPRRNRRQGQAQGAQI